MTNIVTSKTRNKSRADMRQVHERRTHVEKIIGRKLWTGTAEMPKAPPAPTPVSQREACERMEQNFQEHHVKTKRTEPTKAEKAQMKKRVRDEIAPRVARRSEAAK